MVYAQYEYDRQIKNVGDVVNWLAALASGEHQGSIPMTMSPVSVSTDRYCIPRATLFGKLLKSKKSSVLGYLTKTTPQLKNPRPCLACWGRDTLLTDEQLLVGQDGGSGSTERGGEAIRNSNGKNLGR